MRQYYTGHLLVLDKVKRLEYNLIHANYYQEIEDVIEKLKTFQKEGFTHIEQDRDGEGCLLANYRKETDSERDIRLTIEEEHSKLLKERRYQDYLRLKKEFEDESNN